MYCVLKWAHARTVSSNLLMMMMMISSYPIGRIVTAYLTARANLASVCELVNRVVD